MSLRDRRTPGATPSRPQVDFVPSIYGAIVAMNQTAQSEALATGTEKVQIANLGTTTQDLRIAFGESASAAEANLTHSTNHATTGYYMLAAAEGGSQSIAILGVPSSATHIAYENATACDTQNIFVNKGI